MSSSISIPASLYFSGSATSSPVLGSFIVKFLPVSVSISLSKRSISSGLSLAVFSASSSAFVIASYVIPLMLRLNLGDLGGAS